MYLGFLAYCCSDEVDWIRCISSWQPYDSEVGSVSCVEATVKLGWKLLNDCVVLADRKLPEEPATFVEGE